MLSFSQMWKAQMKAFLAKFHRSSGPRLSTPPNNPNDIFARLPFELHVLVIAHLEPRDIDAAIDSSRILRLVWLSDEMWPALADRWFPGLAQQIRLSGVDEPAMSELFRRSCKPFLHLTAPWVIASRSWGVLWGLDSPIEWTWNLETPVDSPRNNGKLTWNNVVYINSRRAEGKFAAAMHYGFGLASDEFFQLSKNVPVSEGGVHSYESVENLEIDDAQRYSRFMMYSNGRAAWWPEGYSMPVGHFRGGCFLLFSQAGSLQEANLSHMLQGCPPHTR